MISIKEELLINEEIRKKEVRLIDSDGSMLGVVSIDEAQQKAIDRNLDLVEIAPQADPPVCKIMDYGKYKFEMMKKEKEAKKKQKVLDIKEVRVSPNIEEHDFEFKAKNAKNFLLAGNKVKITLRFKGREVNYAKLGENVLNKFAEYLSEYGVVEKAPKLEGRNMFMFIAPKTNKE